MGFYRTITIAAACLLSACASPPKAPMPVGGERAPANDPAQIRQFLIESEEVQRLSEENAELIRVLTQSKGQVLDMKRYVISLQEDLSKPRVREVKQEKVISDAKQFRKKVRVVPGKKPTGNIVVPAQIEPKKPEPKAKAVAEGRKSKKPQTAINLKSVVSASNTALADLPKLVLSGEEPSERINPSNALQPKASTVRGTKNPVSNKLPPAQKKVKKTSVELSSTDKSQKVNTTIKENSTTYTFFHDVADTSFIPSVRVDKKMLRDANNAEKVLVVGRADSRNATTRNKLVARERGKNVKRYLIDHGVDESLIKVTHLPTADNLSSLGEANRAADKHSVQITVFN